MRAFVSYSVKNKRWGGAIKAAFDEFGIETFVAHDSLRVSDEWKERIIEELEACSFFVALLSKYFKESEWCGQELGFAVARKDVLIIPLSIDDTNPYGFISHLQGHRLKKTDEVEDLLLDLLMRKHPRIGLPIAIKRVEEASSFRGAEALVEPLVPYFSEFTKKEAESFASAALENNQVWDAALCKIKYLPAFLNISGNKLSKALRNELQNTIINE